MSLTDAADTSAEHSGLTRAGALVRAAIVLLVVVGLDQLTKHTIATSIAPGEQDRFLPGIHFVHVRNSGVAFGFLSGSFFAFKRPLRFSPCFSDFIETRLRDTLIFFPLFLLFLRFFYSSRCCSGF